MREKKLKGIEGSVDKCVKRSKQDLNNLLKRNSQLYNDRIKKSCGSHSIILGGDQPGSYQIFVDEEYLQDNICLGQQYVETFYEGLNDIDQYDLGGSPDNFFVQRIR